MNAIVLLAVQSLFGGSALSAPDDPLPKFGELETPVSAQGRHEPYPWIGVEAMYVRTNFESGIRINDAWGLGADATITLDYGTRSFLGFRFGYVGWNTRTDDDSIAEESVWVRQYRVGLFGAFQARFLEFRIGAVTGGYRFRRDGNNDTAGFLEFEAAVGGRPNEFIWLGVRVMQTWTVTDFNHKNNHGYVNYSIGPAVEVRF